MNVHTLINLQIKCSYIRDDFIILVDEPGLKMKVLATVVMLLWHKQVQKASC